MKKRARSAAEVPTPVVAVLTPPATVLAPDLKAPPTASAPAQTLSATLLRKRVSLGSRMEACSSL